MYTKIVVPIAALTIAIVGSGSIVLHQQTTVLRQPNTMNESTEMNAVDDNTEQSESEANTISNQNTQETEIAVLDIEELAANVDTSDWQTYRNEEYGFEFRYPGDWHRTSDNTIEYRGSEYMQLSPSPIGPNNDYGVFVRVLTEIESEEDLESYLESEIDRLATKGIKRKVANYKLGGTKVTSFQLINDEYVESKDVLIYGVSHFNLNGVFLAMWFAPAGEIHESIYVTSLLSIID